MPSVAAALRRRETIAVPPFLKSRLKKLGPRATEVALQPLDLVKRRALDENEGLRALTRKMPQTETSAVAPALKRRHSFHDLKHCAPSTMLHDLRAYFDPQYRLYLIKKALVKLVRDHDISVEEMFDLVDEDFSGVLERDELALMIRKLDIRVKEVEIDTLMDVLDEDGSEGVDIDEFNDWLFTTEDAWLDSRRRHPEDEFSDLRLLQRDILRFDPLIRSMLGALWDLVDADDSGEVDLDEYVNLSVNLQQAVTDDFDRAEATKIAKREWEFDAQGRSTMNKTLFFWSFFQLADAWRDGPSISSGSYCYFMDFLSERCTQLEVVDGKPSLVWKWSSDEDWAAKIEPMHLIEKRREARRARGLPPEVITTSPLREMARFNQGQQAPAPELVQEAPAPAKLSAASRLAELQRAAKLAVQEGRNKVRRKARRSWDRDQEEQLRLEARAEADQKFLEAKRLRSEMDRLRAEALRERAEEQREATRRKRELAAIQKAERKEAASKREAERLEAAGERREAAELRERARREAAQAKARAQREALAQRDAARKLKNEALLQAKLQSTEGKRRALEEKTRAEHMRLAAARALNQRRRSAFCAAPAPTPAPAPGAAPTRASRESYDDFSYASARPSKGTFDDASFRSEEASVARSHRSDGPPSARSFARSFRSDGTEILRGEPAWDDRSVARWYRADGSEIGEGAADFDDPSAVASVRSFRADGTELRPGDEDWDNMSHVSFARSDGGEVWAAADKAPYRSAAAVFPDALSVQSYHSDGSPLKDDASVAKSYRSDGTAKRVGDEGSAAPPSRTGMRAEDADNRDPETRAAEATARRLRQASEAEARRQQRDAAAAARIEAAKLAGDDGAVERLQAELARADRAAMAALAEANRMSTADRAHREERQRRRHEEEADARRIREAEAAARRARREAAAVARVADSWVAGDAKAAESAAEQLVKANRASTEALDRAARTSLDRAADEDSSAARESYRSNGSLIRPTDPDFATDGRRYRADRTVKRPGDTDYAAPSYRSDATEIKLGDPDYYCGGRGPLASPPKGSDGASSPSKSPGRSDGSYVKPGDDDYDEWSFVSRLTHDEASFMTQASSCVGGGPVGAEDNVSYRTDGSRIKPGDPDYVSVSARPASPATQNDEVTVLSEQASPSPAKSVFTHLTHESSLVTRARGPRDAGWFPPGGHGSYVAPGLILSHHPAHFTDKPPKRAPPPPPERRTDFANRYAYPPSNSLSVADNTLCVSPTKPRDDYFVLEPVNEKRASFDIPEEVPKEAPQCPLWSFGDAPWFSKVLDEQTMALADGALDVGGARAMRLISKQRLARKLGAPSKRRTKRRPLGVKPPRWGPGDEEPFVPGGVAIRDTRPVRYERHAAGEPMLDEPKEGEALERLSAFISTFRRAGAVNDVWAKVCRGGVKPLVAGGRRSLDSIGVGTTVPRGQAAEDLPGRRMPTR